MTYVLDACALIAWLRDEAGADQVEALLLDNGATVMIHAVNLCEVYYDCLRSVGESRAEETVAIESPGCPWISVMAVSAAIVARRGVSRGWRMMFDRNRRVRLTERSLMST